MIKIISSSTISEQRDAKNVQSKMEKSVDILTSHKKSHGPFQKYTAQLVLIDIYTQFLFSAHLFFPQERFVSQTSAIKGLPHPSRCSGYHSLIIIIKKKTLACDSWLCPQDFDTMFPFHLTFCYVTWQRSEVKVFRCLHISVAGVKMLKRVPASTERRVQCCSPRNTVDIRNPGGRTVKAAAHSQEKFPEK